MDPIRLAFPVKTYDVDFAGIVSNKLHGVDLAAPADPSTTTTTSSGRPASAW